MRKQLWLLLAAIALAALALLALVRLVAPPPPPSPPPQAARAPGAAASEPDEPPRPGASVRVAARPRRIARGGTPPARGTGGAAPGAPDAASLPPGHDTSPTHEEPPFTVGPPGTGIGAFPKPGTDPLKIGIVVPESFELPEGYVRHFQVTDDGQPLEPILMFHPDFEWVDEDGRPIPLPEDLVVPAELAPPGLPIRLLEPPPPRAEADEAP